jgi:hypothetical protein
MMRAVVVPSKALCVTTQCRGAPERNFVFRQTSRRIERKPHVSWSSATRPSLEGPLETQRMDGDPKDASGATSVK